jgi:pyruvate/2-oxoglutarate dehydrogenase complex dihydrolipoamide acyltransferase (E2) component
MAFEFKFPDVGEGIHEGRIVEWLVVEGDTVKVDAPLVKVETDKAVVELPSPEAGTILKIHFPPDSVIHVGDVIVTIGTAGEKAEGSRLKAEGEKQVEGGRGKGEGEPALSEPRTPNSEPASLETRNSKLETTASAARPPATPRTRALARKLGVDLAAVTGSGKHGRITDEDVKRAAAGGARGARWRKAEG